MSFRVERTDSLRDRSRSKNWLLIFAVAMLFAFANGESAKADGSWGSSRGGWSSGGSWGSGGSSGGSYGCRGGLFSNQPVRSLISRVGVGLGNGIAGVGNGISNIFDRRRRFGSRGGWGCSGGSNGYGSQGGWGGSSGGNWGSSGGYAASAPMASSAIASPMLLADNGSFQGFTNVLGQEVVSQNYGCTGSISAYVDPNSAYLNSGVPINMMETSAPMLDYGYVGSQFGPLGVPTDATMMNGAIITGPMLEQNPTLAPEEPANGYYDADDDDNSVTEPPIGAVGDNETTSVNRPLSNTVLTLDVPENARVYINDTLTKTEGLRRSYASRNLVMGKEYRYRVKVVSQIDGEEVTKSQVVKMRGGESDLVAFNFDPIVTRLLVSVPADAKVVIDGKETTTKGTSRSFSTQKLTSGKWDDYSVEVSVVRNGKTVTRSEKFDLVAGEFKFLQFDFDKANANAVASK